MTGVQTCALPICFPVTIYELRDTLVPINSRWKVKEVLAAADKYADKTGRRYSIEYALIRDINDQQWRADLLGRLLKNRHAHVNLIPLNPTPGSKWTASRREDERTFVRTLENYGVPVTVRDTRGREIEIAHRIALQALTREAQKGNIQAIKELNQLSGILNQNNNKQFITHFVPRPKQQQQQEDNT